MPKQYACLAEVTVGAGGAANVNFTSIPQTYTDLAVVLSLRGTSANVERNLYYTFNNNSSNRLGKYIEGTGSAVGYISWATMYGGTYPAANSTASTFGNILIYIPNYTSSSYKSSIVNAVMENNATTSYSYLVANLWSDTAAITSIQLPEETGNFAQYSTATLYGITKS